jgi:hypothetical protein
MTPAPCCDTCAFWNEPDYPNPEAPFPCRRFPPPNGAKEVYGECDEGWRGPFWPLTFATDWCGEHQPKPSP